ncbi:MAG: hypothetical protein RSE21_04320 [Bacilli bacterium]
MEFINKNPKIFIISGKAGSGKNTVAKIIAEQKKNTINLAYATPLKEYAKKISSWDGTEETKPRELIQNLGVELIKTKIDNKMLIKRITEDIKVYSYFFECITISDARFPEEIEEIEENFENTTSIRVNRKRDHLTEKEKKHSTETAMNDYNKYDFIIDNNNTLEELKKKVLEVIKNV